MAYNWVWLMDPCVFVILSIAACTILYASYRSLHFPKFFAQQTTELDQNMMKVSTAILLPVGGSIFLVILFYFLDKLFYLLVALLSFSSFVGVSYTFYPLFEFILTKNNLQREYTFRWIGAMPLSALLSMGFGVFMVFCWLLITLIPLPLQTFFFVNDTLAISIAVSVLSFMRLPNLKISTVLLIAFFLYDIFWVFLSEYFFKKNVMVGVASQLPALPMIIYVPRVFTDGGSLLGAGDIVLPGLFLCYLYRFDHHQRTTFKNGYFVRAWVAYILGLIMAMIMVAVLQRGQPALLYLVPFTLVPTFVLSNQRGQLRMLWQGIKEHNEDDPVATSNDTQQPLLQVSVAEQDRE